MGLSKCQSCAFRQGASRRVECPAEADRSRAVAEYRSLCQQARRVYKLLPRSLPRKEFVGHAKFFFSANRATKEERGRIHGSLRALSAIGSGIPGTRQCSGAEFHVNIQGHVASPLDA